MCWFSTTLLNTRNVKDIEYDALVAFSETSTDMLEDFVLFNQTCLIIGHALWFGTSLSAMHVSVVPHYRPCLLVWCLTVGHVFWCGTSLLAMPVGVVPY